MGKSTISMAIFHCYVSSPEGTRKKWTEVESSPATGRFPKQNCWDFTHDIWDMCYQIGDLPKSWGFPKMRNPKISYKLTIGRVMFIQDKPIEKWSTVFFQKLPYSNEEWVNNADVVSNPRGP